MDHPQRRGKLALAVILAIVLASLGLGTQALAQGKSHVLLRGSSPAWAKPSNEIRAASKTRSVSGRVYLKPRHKGELDALVRAVSDPSSKQYRHFITPAQYRSRFGPTSSDVSAVKHWLTGAGLHVTNVSAENRYVAVRGTVAQAQKAFGVKFKLYRHRGKEALAPAGDLSVPKQVSDKVLGVTGLESPQPIVKPVKMGSAPPPPGFRNARPCSLYYGQLIARYKANYKTPLPKFQGSYRPYAVCGYVPSQLRGAYGVTNSSFTGKGATVAITDAYAAPTILKDANKYATRHGDQAFRTGQFSQILPKKGFVRHPKICQPPGLWYGEETST